MIKKGIVIVIIVLFVGAGVVPCTSMDVGKIDHISDSVEKKQDENSKVTVIGFYNREAAYNYAQKYWDEVCSDGYFWDSPNTYISLPLGTIILDMIGYDCAHFVSCCIGNEANEQGGGLNVPSRVPPTYGEPGAVNLGNWLIDESGIAIEVTSIDEMEMGDVIIYTWSNGGHHIALYLGDGKVAAHTKCVWDADWELDPINTTGYRFIHIMTNGYQIAQGDLGGWNGQRKLARTSDGVFHCVYNRTDGQNSQIYHSFSVDDGETWTEESVTFEDYDQVFPDITVDSNDNMHIVWQGCHNNSPTYSQIRYRTYNGNWLQIENITSDFNWEHRSPAIGVDSNDNLHVVFQKVDYIGGSWCQHGCGPAFYTNNIKGFWQNPEMIGEGSEYNDAVPSISIGSNNYLHIAWDAGGYHNANCWHSAYRRNNTNMWEPIKSFPCYDNFPSIAVDSIGNVHHVVKYSYPYIGIKYRMRNDIDWIIEEFIQSAGPPTVTKHPSIALDSNEYIHVVWNNNGNIYYSKKTTDWSAIDPIISDTDSTAPHLIWAWHPEVNGARTNRPKNGFAFIWNDGPIIKFYKSEDLEWENQPPNSPTIDGQTEGKVGEEYEYTFSATDPEGNYVKYFIDWGDNNTVWTSYNPSDTNVKVNHTWSEKGTYTIKAKARDIYDAESDWAEFTVSMPRDKVTAHWLLRFLERLPLLQRLLNLF
jgi:hypothetical protein